MEDLEDIRKYNIRSIIIAVIGALMLIWMFVASKYNLGYCDDEFFGPLGLSLVIFGIVRIFFRTFMRSKGRRVFGIWLILFGGYCYFMGISFLPGIFGFLGGFVFIILGVLFLLLDI